MIPIGIMEIVIAKVRNYGNGRKMVEIPLKDSESFDIGDFVIVKRINPSEVLNA